MPNSMRESSRPISSAAASPRTTPVRTRDIPCRRISPSTLFWPAPNVDSGLVAFARREPPPTTASREEVFAVIDAAFAQRRKTLRAALAGWAGSPAEAERVLRAAGVNPGARGEQLTIGEFARVAEEDRLRRS